jgi:hypothetical protein
MVPDHPFNEMKPNSGVVAMEPCWSTTGKRLSKILDPAQKPSERGNWARMIVHFALQSCVVSF